MVYGESEKQAPTMWISDSTVSTTEYREEYNAQRECYTNGLWKGMKDCTKEREGRGKRRKGKRGGEGRERKMNRREGKGREGKGREGKGREHCK